MFVDQQSFTEGVCGFPVRFDPVNNNQYVVQSSTAPDGTVTQRITGHLDIVLTNLTNGHSVTVNAGGPATVIARADGFVHLDGQGHTILTFGSRTQARLGVPGIALSTGRTEFTFDPNTSPSVSYSVGGRVVDGCALVR